MKIEFEERTYIIRDGGESYKVSHIVRHPSKEVETYNFYIYRENVPVETAGYYYLKPSRELAKRLKREVEEYEASI